MQTVHFPWEQILQLHVSQFVSLKDHQMAQWATMTSTAHLTNTTTAQETNHRQKSILMATSEGYVD